jgi:phosphoribosylformimino-5-aminoimidazole carboxamide ribotide isomerase/imidazole glycerol phosphate synthase glutamine amidotransferase subunit
MIVIVDYGMGNLRSVEKGLAHVGGEVKICQDPESIRQATKLVVPGVGAFDRAVEQLKKRNLWEPVLEGARSGKPFLGICVGFQLLFEESEEGSGEKGFGLFKGSVKRFNFSSNTSSSSGQGSRLKVPHMGWNQVQIMQEQCPLLEGVQDQSYFYFVHSYYAISTQREGVLAETEYGERFTSMIWRDQVFGVQFHPEKSQSVGLTILSKVVRLFKGEFDKVSIYSEDPAQVARQWIEKGAGRIHVVDLDGAGLGELTNSAGLEAILKEVDCPVQFGGGLRTRKAIDQVMQLGVRACILSTAVFDNLTMVREAVQEYGDRILVSVDVRDGWVQARGWKESSSLKVSEVSEMLKKIGVQTVIHTDVSRDGTLEGVNVDKVREFLKVSGLHVIVAGGVKNIEDVQKLKQCETEGVVGMIVGRALYEGQFDLEEALKQC